MPLFHVDVAGVFTLDKAGYKASELWRGLNCVSPCQRGSSLADDQPIINGIFHANLFTIVNAPKWTLRCAATRTT